MKLTNHTALIEVGQETRFGRNWQGKRCLAKTRWGSTSGVPEPSRRVPRLRRPRDSAEMEIEGIDVVTQPGDRQSTLTSVHTLAERQPRIRLRYGTAFRANHILKRRHRGRLPPRP